MENGTLFKARTKYSGLPLTSLIYMIKAKIPVDRFLRRLVWQELFFRYFDEGRLFNIYSLLDKEHSYFAITVQWELQHENVEIPVDHVEGFIKNLLSFMEFIDHKVLESDGGLVFESSLHELLGIRDMLEKVRDAKIKDYTVRQKVNLFIDPSSALRNFLLRCR